MFSNKTVLDAINSFWGDATGPSGAGTGSGDFINQNVNFLPFTEECALIATPAVASVATPQCEALKVLDYSPGLTNESTAVHPDRSITTSAVGSPDGSIVSLGFGGTITLHMSSPVQDNDGLDLYFHEFSASHDTCEAYPESIQVQVSADGQSWTTLGGSVCQDGGVDLDGSGLSSVGYVRLVDVSPIAAFSDGLADGYDLDAVTCTP